MTYVELIEWQARLMETLNVGGWIIPNDWRKFISEAVKSGYPVMASDMERLLKSYTGVDWGDK